MLLNYKNVASDAESTQKSISRLWGEAIEYFCGSNVYVKRYVIAETITKINSTIAGVQGNLDNSWWETFDLCGFDRKRTLYNIFDTTLQRMGRQMVALQDCVVNVDFGKGHKEFCDATHDGMVALKDAASELLEKCHKACQDGTIDSDEEDEIEEAVMLVKECQGKLLSIFGTAASGTHLNHQMEFCFILSVWARKTVDCAECMIECDHEGGQSFLHVMWQGFWKTWQVPSRSKLIWAIRNFISVATAFVVGYQWPCWGEDAVKEMEKDHPSDTCTKDHVHASLFTPYDANMTMTLSLLINHYPGAALVNNIQRLLGVVMGKVIPMVIHGALFIFNIHDLKKSMVLGCSLFIFTWGTTYMYYSSERWSLVGRLMAGFGCALLSRPMDEEKLVNYTAYYKELAQVVMAICFQMLIDLIFDWMEGGFPRDSAVKKVKEAQISIKKAFHALFDGNLQTLIEATRDAEGLVKAAKDLWFEVDPGMQLTPGYRAKFKADLYRSALLKLELLCSDLVMLILATRPWKGHPTPEHGNDKIALEDELDSESEEEEEKASSFNVSKFFRDLDSVMGKQGIREELVRYFDLVLDSLEALLEHGAEDNNFQDAGRTRELITLKRVGFLRWKSSMQRSTSAASARSPGSTVFARTPMPRWQWQPTP